MAEDKIVGGRAWSVPLRVASLGAVALSAAACSSSSPVGGFPPPGDGSPAAAASGFVQGVLAGKASAACGYVLRSNQSACETVMREARITATHPGLGNTYTDGNEAMVVVMATKACASVTSSPTTTCSSNSDPNAGLPTSNDQFAKAYKAALSASGALGVVDTTQQDGKWFVNLGVGGSGPPHGSTS